MPDFAQSNRLGQLIAFHRRMTNSKRSRLCSVEWVERSGRDARLVPDSNAGEARKFFGLLLHPGLREQADESLLHAQQVGEWITTLGAYPSLAIGPLLDSHTFDISSILRESLQAENLALRLYRELLARVEDRSVALEEFARQMIHIEEMHAGEVDKMLRRPGEMTTSAEGQAARR